MSKDLFDLDVQIETLNQLGNPQYVPKSAACVSERECYQLTIDYCRPSENPNKC